MARLYDTGIFSANATDGSIGVGYKLYFYITGTTTPKNTYPTRADAIAGTNANANPVVAAADGRWNPIWLTSGDYKVILKDFDDVTLETRDPADSGLDNVAHIDFTQSGSTVSRTLQSKLGEFVSVKDFGALGDGSTDDLSAIDDAVASGAPLLWPAGTYRITGTITCTTDQVWIATGDVTIVYDAASSSAAAPAIDFRAKIVSSGNFTIDHQADTKSFTAPTVYAGQVIAGSAVLVQGDYSSLDGWRVRDAWDNGIAAIKMNTSTGVITSGSPKYGSFTNVKTSGCGVGEHVSPAGKVGGGIDVGSASAWTVSDCVDFASYNGFILDTGAGANCTFSNLVAWATKFDSTNPSSGSGYGFYVGSLDSVFVNCWSYLSEYRGWWIDAQGNDLVNCGAYVPQREGAFIKYGQSRIQLRVKGAGAASANTYDAVLIDSSFAAITELELDLHTTGSNHRYGVSTTGANGIRAHVRGSVTGTTGKVNAGSYAITTELYDTSSGKISYNKDSAGFEFDHLGRARYTAPVANSDYTGAAFGDTGNNGTMFIEDFATPAKRMAMGYDPTNDAFVVQAIHSGTAKKPLLLNPSGGDVMAGGSSWTTGHMRLGAYHLWVDSSGRLRIKSSAPSSDTDGTIVGTQS